MTQPNWMNIPLEADEPTMLRAFLDFYRVELVDRARGVSADELQITLTDSGLSLGRLISHMAWVEQIWFTVRLDGEAFRAPFDSLDFDADEDAEMALSAQWSFDELVGHFDDAVADSNRRIDASEYLDRRTVATNKAGDHWSLRWILIHMIEEYARHCGHADLIRESIDGNTVD